MQIYDFNGTPIYDETFIDALVDFINPGDTLYIEIDTKVFGKLCRGLTRDDFLAAIFSIFHSLVGPDGNIIFPAFSYSWGEDKELREFDVRKTKCKVGLFPEYFRNRPDVLRTMDPMFSCSVFGPKKVALTNTENTSFGKGSIYEKLCNLNAKLISFGLSQFDPTIVHAIEEKYQAAGGNIPYRFVKKLTGTLVDYSGTSHEGVHYSFLRNLEKGFYLFRDTKLVSDLQKHNLINEIQIGNGKIYISDCASIEKIAVSGFAKNPYYFVEKQDV